MKASQTPTREQMDAAIAAINDHGFDFRAPWECDMDDREREEFEGLQAAIAAALALSSPN
ncbi:hypothetical protein IVB34_12570 [Bradyrhizobium sp. 2]|uniref:hypothetical protein n=1 Tax=Bradyrhizobium sp. 2 TaxID=190045 RepID=UPI001FF8102B|nr:hypothetical protein [Bradyrhizobium sp. 2]MCK1459124.1 hypothetical protein [Bradyrhizobium sp. 2]MCK1459189.1 hypothetical protein [Bradyrhizobium sp. 2]